MAKMIVGLGNPGARYAHTRHNVGWMVLDAFCQKHGIMLDKQGFHSIYGDFRWTSTGDKVILLKPLTFMNLSGRAIAAAAHFYKIEPADILVVYDELDLPVGRLRLREKGGAGGHNGMKSIISELGTQEFPRLRIGIGRPAPGWEGADWVLAPLVADDAASVSLAVSKAAEAAGVFLTEGILKAMTQFNGA